ncbi:MAG: YceD family protein, partial [Lachnospiraceae bacterium]
MMILDVKKLNGLKEYTGTAEFTFEPEAALIDIPYVSFDGNAVARISYEIFEDGAVEVKGDVSYRLKGLCSRCLKETATDVKSCVDAVYLTEDNGEDYAYDGNKIDLSELFK